MTLNQWIPFISAPFLMRGDRPRSQWFDYHIINIGCNLEAGVEANSIPRREQEGNIQSQMG